MDSQVPFAVDLTSHAARRMQQRGISETAIVIALLYGREIYIRGAWVCVIGHKEVARCRREGLDLSAHAGLHVVLSPDGAVLTVYRNADLRGLRPRGRRHRAA